MSATTAERMPSEPTPVAPTRDRPADVEPLQSPRAPRDPQEQEPFDIPVDNDDDTEDDEEDEDDEEMTDEEREERE